jgi:apolipoprotein N-acyltransferase
MPRVFLPAVLSGMLLWAAFFPFDLGPIAFVALVPWLTLVRAPVSRRRRYFAAYVGACVFFTLATNWLTAAHPMMYFSWIGLSLVLPLFWLLGLDWIRRGDSLGLPLALSVPIVWVALEYTRMHFPTGFIFLKPLGLYQMIGFGWYFLGYSQHAFLPLIQIADVGGVYAVSFLVAAVNGLLADRLLRLDTVRRWLRWPNAVAVTSRTRHFASPALVSILVVGTLVYGFIQLAHPAFTPGPLVAALQGSVPQGQKMLKGNELEEAYSRVLRKALSAKPRPDLIVWPETCFAMDWCEVPSGQQPPVEFAQAAESRTREFSSLPFRVPMLLGLSAIEWENGQEWKYNSALMVTPRGTKIARYDKMHLVPFGEYVPLRDYFPFLQAFTPYPKEYSCRPGEQWTRFPLTTADGRSFTFGCLICYEDSDTYLARQYVATEPVDFFVNISNDGWFDGTEEHEEHLAICRFRAVEARRAIVRSVNMGISAIIDSDGRVIALPRDSWSSSKKVEAVVSAFVPVDNRDSWYSQHGDWLPAGCWLVAIGVFVMSKTRKQPVRSF